MKLSFTLFLLSVVPISAFASPVAASERPNIVLVLCDDAGIGDYQPYSSLLGVPDKTALRTPNTDRLANEGMLFTRAHSTGSVCQPSRYSILSGKFPIRINTTRVTQSMEDRIMDGKLLTLPQMLQKQGYRTAIVGKWHLDYLLPTNDSPQRGKRGKPAPHRPLPLGAEDYGFDYGFWLLKGATRYFVENRRIVKLDREIEYSQAWPGRSPWPGHRRWQTSPYETDEQIVECKREQQADAITDKALDFIETASAEKVPFFLYLAVISPHAPHIPAEEINGTPLIEGAKNLDGSPANNNRQIVVYENDIILGQVMEQLDRLKLTENTIVIFASDNGAGVPGVAKDGASGHFRGTKGTGWEGGNREPFIVKWPGVVEPGTRTDALVSQVDLFRTFAEVLNVELPPEAAIDSQSFLPLLKGEGTTARSIHFAVKHKEAPYADFCNGYFNISVSRADNMKLIAFFDPKNEKYKAVELYDLGNDPSETNNLVKQPAYAATINELLRQLDDTLALAPVERTDSTEYETE